MLPDSKIAFIEEELAYCANLLSEYDKFKMLKSLDTSEYFKTIQIDGETSFLSRGRMRGGP
jgi:lipid II:glycine glycyltransferase (peptidoglycan interpeptide bridge formation enzyme)